MNAIFVSEYVKWKYTVFIECAQATERDHFMRRYANQPPKTRVEVGEGNMTEHFAVQRVRRAC